MRWGLWTCFQAVGFKDTERDLETHRLFRKMGVLSRLKTFVFCAITFGSLFFSPLAQADSRYRSKLGIDLTGFKPNLDQPVGWLTGLTWGQYFGDSQVYWGIGAYFGTPTGRALTEEYLTYGGLLVGWEIPTSKRTLFELDLLVGYGQGEKKLIGLKQNSYYVAQPGVGFGFKLGQGWKMLFTAHYVHMADAKDFSGPSFGLRFEFKSLSTTKFVND